MCPLPRAPDSGNAARRAPDHGVLCPGGPPLGFALRLTDMLTRSPSNTTWEVPGGACRVARRVVT
ncbi:hypothetical protein FRAHR75_210058 [Frankia sp. Hr75.2]|nr:hypothetical protein FRAHR75_210058 [Frankia sp. Hr75.2]